MNKIIIIPPDAFISIDGDQHFGVDMSAAPAGVRAMRWHGNKGVVETGAGERHIDTLQDWIPVLRAIHAAPPPQQQDPQPVGPTPEKIRADRIAAVYGHMNAAAQGLGYDDILSAVTYADEPIIPRLQAEGRGFRAWRSLVWAHCYQVLDDVQEGRRPIPTDAELIGELPALHIEYPAASKPEATGSAD